VRDHSLEPRTRVATEETGEIAGGVEEKVADDVHLRAGVLEAPRAVLPQVRVEVEVTAHARKQRLVLGVWRVGTFRVPSTRICSSAETRLPAHAPVARVGSASHAALPPRMSCSAGPPQLPPRTVISSCTRPFTRRLGAAEPSASWVKKGTSTTCARRSSSSRAEELRRQGADVAHTISGPSDAELERVDTFWGESVRTREFVERWIEDIGQHLAEIRATAGKQSASRAWVNICAWAATTAIGSLVARISMD
jgi:hypothetical protein